MLIRKQEEKGILRFVGKRERYLSGIVVYHNGSGGTHSTVAFTQL